MVALCTRLRWLLVLMLIVTASPIARADALRKVERELSPPRERSSRSSGSRAAPSSPGSADDDDAADSVAALLLAPLFEAAGQAFLAGVTAPWWAPRRYDDVCLAGYAARPFAAGPGTALDDCDPYVSHRKRTLLQLDLESGYMLEGAIPASLSLRYQLPRRFEISARGTFLSDVIAQPTEYAFAGTVHVLWHHALARRVDFRTGVGMRLFSMDSTRAGLDLLYGIDGYPSQWSIVRVELHAGLFAHAFTAEARGTIGALLGPVELYAGYGHTVFAGASRATLRGPIAGVRAWF